MIFRFASGVGNPSKKPEFLATPSPVKQDSGWCWRLDDVANIKSKFFGEFKVALVMARNSHDGARSVADENIVCDPDWDLFLVHRVNGESAGENAGLFLCKIRPFEIGFG